MVLLIPKQEIIDTMKAKLISQGMEIGGAEFTLTESGLIVNVPPPQGK